eukprot:COSAG02_NODE_1274_length_13507_cov_8.324060_9_plen_392_part_00
MQEADAVRREGHDAITEAATKEAAANARTAEADAKIQSVQQLKQSAEKIIQHGVTCFTDSEFERGARVLTLTYSDEQLDLIDVPLQPGHAWATGIPGVAKENSRMRGEINWLKEQLQIAHGTIQSVQKLKQSAEKIIQHGVTCFTDSEFERGARVLNLTYSDEQLDLIDVPLQPGHAWATGIPGVAKENSRMRGEINWLKEQLQIAHGKITEIDKWKTSKFGLITATGVVVDRSSGKHLCKACRQEVPRGTDLSQEAKFWILDEGHRVMPERVSEEEANLRAVLERKKLLELHAAAVEANADPPLIERATESARPKEALIALLLELKGFHRFEADLEPEPEITPEPPSAQRARSATRVRRRASNRARPPPRPKTAGALLFAGSFSGPDANQ